MFFHVQTTLLIAALVGVMLGGMQLLASQRLQATPLAYWAAASLSLSSACAFFALRRELGIPVSVLAGNGLVFLGTGLLLSGIRTFDGRRARLDLVVLVSLAGVAALAVSVAEGDRMAERVTIASLLVAVLAAMAGSALIRRSDFGPLLSRFASGVLLLGVAAAFAVRGLVAWSGFAPDLGALNNLADLMMILAATVLVVAWSFGSLFMVLERLASVDDLTGLLNRRATLQQAQRLLSAAKGHGRPLAVLLADLDHFKSVNDRFGHEVGDTVLRHFAWVLRSAVRPRDVVGRHGGEEFCIVLPGADGPAALAVAEHLRHLAERELYRVDGYETRVTLTIGVACFSGATGELCEVKDLIGASDAALYRAKLDGRNRVAGSGHSPLEAGRLPLDDARIAAGPST
ncbi:diguanylate cyclase [Xanthobacter sp. AM11]|uniref:GGDEF domain-containing protein n=1 Tax=Xanthobacter sp. AM11 TaxID=3380643 RepID=UPI0039BFE0A9